MLDTNHLTKLARNLHIRKLLFIIDACQGTARDAGSRSSADMTVGMESRNMPFPATPNERSVYRYFLMSGEEPVWRNGSSPEFW